MSDSPAHRRIRVQTTPRDPHTLRFILDAPVQGAVSVFYEAANADAPLAQALFDVAGVRRVDVSGASIHVVTAPDADLPDLKVRIAAAIRAVLDAEAMPLGTASGPAPAPDAQLFTAVRDLLDRKANPSIASHGGSVAVERVEDGHVYLRMSGGCQGCAASSATLRQGIETMLRAALPAIREIIDLTDHGAGTNPFYAGAPGQTPVMNRWLPEGVVQWEDGQIIIDPDYLAPRLGLTPDTLLAGLRGGHVFSVTETGKDEHAGKTRITVRSPVRAWAAELLPDGTAREVPPPRDQRGAQAAKDTLAPELRQYLEGLAPQDVPVTYGALAREFGLWAPGSIAKVTRALEVTMREDAATGSPFIAARVVNRGAARLPGKGFFDLARELGQGPQPGETERDHHARHLREGAELLAVLHGTVGP